MCDFFPVSGDEIRNWDGRDAGFLLKLDSHGIFPGNGEDAESFRARLLTEYNYIQSVNDPDSQKKDKIILWQSEDRKDKLEVRNQDRIDKNLFLPAWEKTRELYDFSVDYVPGFYLFEKVGLLWGGCSIYDDESQMKVFLLRPAFRNKNRFLIYSRDELIAHELCHCARQVLHDHKIEEYFAYQTSSSPLRRYIGNCFIKSSDALIFLLPALMLPIAQAVKNFIFQSLPIWPFTLLIIASISYFLIRNQHSRNVIAKAKRNLAPYSSKPEAILFRSDFSELKKLSISFEKYYSSLSPIRKTIIDALLNKNPHN